MKILARLRGSEYNEGMRIAIGLLAASLSLAGTLPTPSAVKVKPKRTAVRPKIDASKWPKKGEFTVEFRKKEPDRVRILFKPKNPGTTLDLQGPFLLKLVSDPELEITPKIIQRKEWPQAGNELIAIVKGRVPSKIYRFILTGIYRACQANGKECKSVRAQTSTLVLP